MSLQQADAELKAIDRQLEQEYPAFRRGWSVKVISLRQELLGDLEGHVRSALFILMAAVGFLLLIYLANMANLQLAHGISRERELALRRALGAGRWRLVRQLLTESLLLALLGGIATLSWAAGELAAADSGCAQSDSRNFFCRVFPMGLWAGPAGAGVRIDYYFSYRCHISIPLR